jgi:hypothetical protein
VSGCAVLTRRCETPYKTCLHTYMKRCGRPGLPLWVLLRLRFFYGRHLPSDVDTGILGVLKGDSGVQLTKMCKTSRCMPWSLYVVHRLSRRHWIGGPRVPELNKSESPKPRNLPRISKISSSMISLSPSRSRSFLYHSSSLLPSMLSPNYALSLVVTTETNRTN